MKNNLLQKIVISWLSWCICINIFLPLPSFSSSYNNPYLVLDVQTGQILAQNRVFDRWYPASLTKLMTSYLTFKALAAGDLSKDSKVTLSLYAVSQPPSRSGYRAGTVLDLDTALKIMLVKSTNDIATSIGELIGGTHANFVKLMNLQAKQLSMNYTHFTSANGLPNSANYSTARDFALLARAIRLDFPQYSSYFNIEAIRFDNSAKVVLNSNNLLGRFAGIDGMKTGFICASGYNLVASATRNGQTLIAVILGATRLDLREERAAQLLEAGFNTLTANKPTIEQLEPIAGYKMQAPNISQNVCSLDSWKKRSHFMDKTGRPIIESPYILPKNTQLHIEAVAPLYVPPMPSKAAPIVASVKKSKIHAAI